MSHPSWGHSSPRLHDFLSNALYRLAALGDAALEHEFTQDPEEEAGSAMVAVVYVLGACFLALCVGAVGVLAGGWPG